jgi:hypothetical protein
LDTLRVKTQYKTNVQFRKLEQKLGEVLGLEMAAQKAVEELSAKGLLDEAGVKTQVEGMKQEANNHQKRIEELVETLSTSGLVIVLLYYVCNISDCV